MKILPSPSSPSLSQPPFFPPPPPPPPSSLSSPSHYPIIRNRQLNKIISDHNSKNNNNQLYQHNISTISPSSTQRSGYYDNVDKIYQKIRYNNNKQIHHPNIQMNSMNSDGLSLNHFSSRYQNYQLHSSVQKKQLLQNNIPQIIYHNNNNNPNYSNNYYQQQQQHDEQEEEEGQDEEEEESEVDGEKKEDKKNSKDFETDKIWNKKNRSISLYIKLSALTLIGGLFMFVTFDTMVDLSK